LQHNLLIEEYIDGRELYVSVLGSRSPTVFPPREVFFNNMPADAPKFATYHAKWNDAYRKKWGITNGAAQVLPPEVDRDLRKIARNVYGWLKIRGCGRLDVRMTPTANYS
jgi:D-alanine-D-alanine ligase